MHGLLASRVHASSGMSPLPFRVEKIRRLSPCPRQRRARARDMSAACHGGCRGGVGTVVSRRRTPAPARRRPWYVSGGRYGESGHFRSRAECKEFGSNAGPVQDIIGKPRFGGRCECEVCRRARFSCSRLGAQPTHVVGVEHVSRVCEPYSDAPIGNCPEIG